MLPKHIAIIMDGNGRWAKSQGLPRFEGHRKGVETVDDIVTAVRELKIPTLTLYAFSDENWRRPPDEVEMLMLLLEEFLKLKQAKMLKNGIRLQTIGDIERLPASTQKTLAETIELTKNGKELNLILALSYGARNELVRGINRCLKENKERNEVTEETFSKYLDTKNFPDPDLLIRTSGEHRLSNFLLWQLAYTELYFTKTMWPDFNPSELAKALEEYSKRERRFGKTSEQL
ncbi:MAG: di-trans,poly-cis-decaprenylcistransferase [Deltaproteobacteria bacterium RIFCSPLOWO2_02_FULL_46_8]|nr:MAG: di-trans,poly-cis-decaprenylcistransferase [Deltaproteobacteria bacterium RIFCSPLOWO2_02_FULL_46_8]